MQKILTAETEKPSLRSEFVGWTVEDGDLAAENIHKVVGLIPSARTRLPETPLHALGMGWRLLSPPSFDSDTNTYDWWFEKYNSP